MGTNSLPKLAAAPTKVAATTTQYNSAVDALQGHLVMRDSDGAVEDGVSDIGRPSSGRPRKVHVAEAITVGGQTLNITPFLLSRTGIQSGKEKASGYPDYLSVVAASRKVKIDGSITAIDMTIDGAEYSLEAALESDDLAIAPSSNNTCLINQPLFTGSAAKFSKTVGEYGWYIDIDTVGSEITARNGRIECFSYTYDGLTEYFIAQVNTTAGYIRPLKRGIGGTQRLTLKDNATLTLLKTSWIFLDNDLATIYATNNTPIYSPTEPTSPTPIANDHWYDTTNNTWKRYSGTSWEQLGEILIGLAICNTTICVACEPEDFNLSWDGYLDYQKIVFYANEIRIHRNFSASVAGQKNQLLFSSPFIISTAYEGENTGASGGDDDVDWHYLYVDRYMNFILSDVAPRPKDLRNGYYHPTEYYRCVSAFKSTTYGTVFDGIQIKGQTIISDDTAYNLEAYSITGSSGSPDVFVDMASNDFCPITSRHILTLDMIYSSGTAYIKMGTPGAEDGLVSRDIISAGATRHCQQVDVGCIFSGGFMWDYQSLGETHIYVYSFEIDY